LFDYEEELMKFWLCLEEEGRRKILKNIFFFLS